MGRREKPIDDLQPFAEFANGLRTLRVSAGRPSLRAIAHEIHYSAGHVSDALSGKTLPTWDFTSAFVRVCGGEQKEWSVRWEQARSAKAAAGGSVPAATANGPTRPSLGADHRESQAERDGAAKVLPVDPAEVHNREELSRALNQLRGARSYRDLELAARRRGTTRALSPSTLSDLLSGRSMPSPATITSFLTACGVDAAAQRPWLAAWERVSSAHLRYPAGAVRVREANPRLLGVHGSIQVGTDVDALPAYVARDVDAVLRDALAVGRDRGELVLVVGSSSSGKTRTMFEAVRAVVPEWWLLYPSDAAAVRAFAASPTPRTVVWLDELQRYFTEPGGIPAGVIRALLAAKVLVVGTLWPEEFATRIALPAPGAVDQYAEDRAVLAMAQSIQIGSTLSAGERKHAEQVAADPRIRKALESADAGLTQVLAAGPELVSWWENAGSDRPESRYGKAIITAALDARRLGVTAALSREFLMAAAPAYLTSADRAVAPPDWFDQAIGYATTRLRGAVSCLTAVAAGMGAVDGWATSDYLHQYAQRRRRAIPVPDQVWQAVTDHHRPGDTRRLAISAERWGRPAQARQLWDRGMEQPVAEEAPVARMVRQGRVDELRQLADAGDTSAVSGLAKLLVELGRIEEAAEALRRPADAGDGEAAAVLADLLVALGRRDADVENLLRTAFAGAAFAAIAVSAGRSADPPAQHLDDEGQVPGGPA